MNPSLFDGPDAVAREGVRRLIDQCSVPTFDDFWRAWPNRVAKKDAQRAWAKLRVESKAAALAALPGHIEQWRCQGRARCHIPHPATWLNGERWDDELGEIFTPVVRQAQSGPGWWTSEALTDQMARRVGAYPARNGESWAQYRDRIRVAIDEAGAG